MKKISPLIVLLLSLSFFSFDHGNKNEPTPTYKVGDRAHGGIVFWVSADGKHGKVCTGKDLGEVSFLQIQQGTEESVFFFNLSDPSKHDDEGKKYQDWRLPTIEELLLMYKNLHKQGIGNFLEADEMYWSGDPGPDALNKMVVDFEDGRDFDFGVEHELAVRAVREF